MAQPHIMPARLTHLQGVPPTPPRWRGYVSPGDGIDDDAASF
jgi:hypothetical protein